MLNLDKRYESFSEMLANIPRETIGTIGDAKLTIPVEVPTAVPMAYNRTRLNRGDDIAVTWALELMLGAEGMNDLLESGATDSDWAVVTEIVIGRVRGATVGTADAAPKASTNGSQTSPKPAASRRRAATRKS